MAIHSFKIKIPKWMKWQHDCHLKNIERGTANEKGNIEVTLLEDEKYLSKYGISNTPALVINDKVVSQGKVLTEKEINHYIKLLS